MAKSFKDKMEAAGDKIAETATRVGDRISEETEEAADWVKEKTGQAGAPLSESTGPVGSTADIREHMDVYASCGAKVGRVDHVEGHMIKLTKNDSPDGQHHLIPMSWVAKVHDHIHLDRDHKAVQSQWQPV